jgi:ATP/ADP translocase
MDNTNVPSANAATGLRLLIDFRPGEGRLLAWAFLYLFAVFSSYYVIRPIRDESGLAGGVSNLSWLFTGTLVAMMALNPAFTVRTNFAFARPTREVLFTVLSREDKYKTKNFIDTVVYRLGDQVGAWSSALVTWAGLGMASIQWTAVPLALAWVGNAWWLGRKQEREARTMAYPSFDRAIKGVWGRQPSQSPTTP